MNHKKNIIIVASVALALSIIGFILDLNERVPSIYQNIIDITMMAAIFFSIGMMIYSIIAISANLMKSKSLI